MNNANVPQAVIDSITNASNILVAVSNNPSVDALSAAVGLSLVLDKLDKYATTIFSGATPPAIAFLQPEKIFDDTTDSLRDFIIALDKEKADHLRYKLDGDLVKIFITPYKTTISQTDLTFSQGDFNVDLVIALGVDNQEHLDTALAGHGQILHDATVVTVTIGQQTSNLGGVEWHDGAASSLSELMTGLATTVTAADGSSLLDQQSATALLTGIVAETDRFSNPKTTSQVMTIAAQLMAAGADQQLIATNLQSAPIGGSGASTTTVIGAPTNAITIEHDEAPAVTVGEVPVVAASEVAPTIAPPPVTPDGVASAYALDDATAVVAPQEPVPAPTPLATEAPEPTDTSALTEASSDHAYLEPLSAPAPTEPTNDLFSGNATPAPGSVDVNALPIQSSLSPAYALDDVAPVSDVPAADVFASAAPAPQTGEATPAVQPAAAPVAPSPGDIGLPLPPPLPDFSQPGIAPSAIAAPAPAPAILGDILTDTTAIPAPAQPVLPPAPVAAPAPVTNDPGQFKIPGSV